MRIPTALALMLLAAAPAAARTNPAPQSCGLTPNKHYEINIDADSRCEFGFATYHALQSYDKNVHQFYSADERNFTLNVSYNGHRTKMDCRSLTRAHGELDFYCNNLNRYGTHVVHFDNATLP